MVRSALRLPSARRSCVRRADRHALIVRFPGSTFFSVLTRKLGWGGLADRDRHDVDADRAAHQEFRDHRIAHACRWRPASTCCRAKPARGSRSSSARSACCSVSARAATSFAPAPIARWSKASSTSPAARDPRGARRPRRRRRERHRRASSRGERERARTRVGERDDGQRRRARGDRSAARESARPARGADAPRPRRAASDPRRVRRCDGAGDRRFATRTTTLAVGPSRHRRRSSPPRRRRDAAPTICGTSCRRSSDAQLVDGEDERLEEEARRLETCRRAAHARAAAWPACWTATRTPCCSGSPRCSASLARIQRIDPALARLQETFDAAFYATRGARARARGRTRRASSSTRERLEDVRATARSRLSA